MKLRHSMFRQAAGTLALAAALACAPRTPSQRLPSLTTWSKSACCST